MGCGYSLLLLNGVKNMNKNKVLKHYNAFYVLSLLSILLEDGKEYNIIHNEDGSQITIKEDK